MPPQLRASLQSECGSLPERKIVTDGLCSYSVAMNLIGTADRHEVGGRLNNRAENSQQPFRRREIMTVRLRSQRAPATIFHERRPKAVIGLVGHVPKKLGNGLMALFQVSRRTGNDAESTARRFDERGDKIEGKVSRARAVSEHRQRPS